MVISTKGLILYNVNNIKEVDHAHGSSSIALSNGSENAKDSTSMRSVANNFKNSNEKSKNKNNKNNSNELFSIRELIDNETRHKGSGS